MKDFFKSPRTKKVLKFLLWFLLWFVVANVGLILIVINGEGHYTRDGKELFYVIVMAICLVSIIFLLPILAIFVRLKTTLILGATVGYYFLFIADLIYIPFYYLDPAYYKYQSECKKLPKPVIYDEDYWNVWLHWAKLKLYNQDGSPKGGVIGYIESSDIPFYYSKKLDKKFEEKWRYQGKKEETWWGTAITRERYNDDIHFATTITNYYEGLIFRFGMEKIGFSFEEMECANFERDGYCDPKTGICSFVGSRDDL